VVDNLERALASAEESEQHLAEGVRLVYSELVSLLERNGVEPFDPKGEPFDPEVHEALSTRGADGTDPGVILDVVEKGYRLNGTVLRPARVVVSA
jgi:molecular chaperone GrpE